jgi:hypothetical protein
MVPAIEERRGGGDGRSSEGERRRRNSGERARCVRGRDRGRTEMVGGEKEGETSGQGGRE